MSEYFREKNPLFLAVLAGILFFFTAYFLWLVPAAYPLGSLLKIPTGASVRGVAEDFERLNVVSSALSFELLARLSGQDSFQAGTYLLNAREGMFTLLLRLTRGEHGLSLVKITFPEGLSLAESASLCAKTLLGCAESEFLRAAEGREGYLFPETYFFLPGAEASTVVKAMRQEFEKRTIGLEAEALRAGHSWREVLIMASILEGEASSTLDRRAVAGVLWQRLAIGMPLQADATFKYINGKNTYTLTTEDLAVDSPYNTYRYRGLPPTPINNPGFDAIKAALEPIKSPYLYYLTDKDGKFYFARTHEEHVRNKSLYLR